MIKHLALHHQVMASTRMPNCSDRQPLVGFKNGLEKRVTEETYTVVVHRCFIDMDHRHGSCQPVSGHAIWQLPQLQARPVLIKENAGKGRVELCTG